MLIKPFPRGIGHSADLHTKKNDYVKLMCISILGYDIFGKCIVLVVFPRISLQNTYMHAQLTSIVHMSSGWFIPTEPP